MWHSFVVKSVKSVLKVGIDLHNINIYILSVWTEKNLNALFLEAERFSYVIPSFFVCCGC